MSQNYGDVYNSIDLSTNTEVIFWRNYAKDIQGHSTVDYTTGSTAQRGVTKMQLMPSCSLTVSLLLLRQWIKSDKVELKDGKLSIEKMLSQRDKRLSVIIDPYVGIKDYGYSRAPELGLAEMTSSTGYTIKKNSTQTCWETMKLRFTIVKILAQPTLTLRFSGSQSFI